MDYKDEGSYGAGFLLGLILGLAGLIIALCLILLIHYQFLPIVLYLLFLSLIPFFLFRGAIK